VNGILETLVAAGVVLAGLVARLGIFLLALTALLVPVLLVAGGARAVKGAAEWIRGYRPAGGLRFRKGLLYSPGHTWVRPEGRRLRVGLDDLAQRLLPWAVAVELPRPGRKVAEGEPVARVCCGNHEARVAAPVAGTVVAVNRRALQDPTLLKSQNYGAGWLFAIEPATPDWKRLPGGEAARRWLCSEGERLSSFCDHQLGLAAADGGELIAPPTSLLGELQWKALTKEFLKT